MEIKTGKDDNPGHSRISMNDRYARAMDLRIQNALLQSRGNSQEAHRSLRNFAAVAQGPLASWNACGMYVLCISRGR